jgi:drug/metabolite transporter (DMT)-like permease
MTAGPRRERRQAVALVVGAGAAFATSGPLTRVAGALPPTVIVCGRVALAAAALFAIAPRATLRALSETGRGQLAGTAAAGALLAAHFVLFVAGLQRTSLPAAVSLVSLEPLSVVLLAWLLHGPRPTAREQLGVLAATVGALLVGRAAGRGEHRVAGDLLVTAAVLVYGLYVTAARAYRRQLAPGVYASLVYAAAALASAVALPLAAPIGPVSPRAAAAIVGLALVPTLMGHTAVQAAAQTLPPAVVGLVSPAETLGSLLLGAVWLGAVPTGQELTGALVIVAGVTLAIL